MTLPDLTGLLRPEQQAIVHGYDDGKVGIAAVPGSGKTYTLAHLAARLVAQGASEQQSLDEREVLIVTFTNTAVNGFRARIAHILQTNYGLLPHIGYRVRTLHGLAHDIVRERPSLVGLADDFEILDDRVALDVLKSVALQHLQGWRDDLLTYVNPDVEQGRAWRSLERDLPEMVARFIGRAKDLQHGPDDLQQMLAAYESPSPLLRYAILVYTEYQRSLAYRGAVDFDDLVRLALDALAADPEFLARLQQRWPYILEDEAQDSSHLQQRMLQALSRGQNWVRVGDPNQAINTTFTTADPQHLLNFLDGDVTGSVREYPLSVSGRSAPVIFSLANELVRWTYEEHQTPDLRDAFDLKHDKQRGILRGIIRPTPPGDPQPNPHDHDAFIWLDYAPGSNITTDAELEKVVAGEDYSLKVLLDELSSVPEHERPTIAVLVPENSRGFKVTEMLRRYGIPYEELLRSTTRTRDVVSLLQRTLEYLADPLELQALKRLFWVLLPPEKQTGINDDPDLAQLMRHLFAGVSNTEEFLWPGPDQTGMALESIPDRYQWLVEALENYRQSVGRWLQALILPIDQLVLTIGQDIFTDPSDVALTYKVAVLLRNMAEAHTDWRLAEFIGELRLISNNERKFIGFEDVDSGYEPVPGTVTVATMHAAKGLEWDRVYLMAVSNYGFPSGMANDTYIGERWYVRDGLNLEAELMAQLDDLIRYDPSQHPRYREGDATLQARIDYAKERLRLLYVGITRAHRDLIITWNTGRFAHRGIINQPALPLVVLRQYLNTYLDSEKE